MLSPKTAKINIQLLYLTEIECDWVHSFCLETYFEQYHTKNLIDYGLCKGHLTEKTWL